MPGINPWEYAEKSGTEHAHQAALFMWANMACRFGFHTSMIPAAYTEAGWAKNYSERALSSGNDFLVPQLEWLHAIHNQGRDAGTAGKIRGGIAKAEGVKAGVSDCFLPVPRLAWFDYPVDLSHTNGMICGFYLELKVGNNKPSDIQIKFMQDMRLAGYHCDVAWGWLEARQKICDYLQINC